MLQNCFQDPNSLKDFKKHLEYSSLKRNIKTNRFNNPTDFVTILSTYLQINFIGIKIFYFYLILSTFSILINPFISFSILCQGTKFSGDLRMLTELFPPTSCIDILSVELFFFTILVRKLPRTNNNFNHNFFFTSTNYFMCKYNFNHFLLIIIVNRRLVYNL